MWTPRHSTVICTCPRFTHHWERQAIGLESWPASWVWAFSLQIVLPYRELCESSCPLDSVGKGTSLAAVDKYMSSHDSEIWFHTRNKQGEESKYMRPGLMLLIVSSWFQICQKVNDGSVQSHWFCCSSESIKSSSKSWRKGWFQELSKSSLRIIQTRLSSFRQGH